MKAAPELSSKLAAREGRFLESRKSLAQGFRVQGFRGLGVIAIDAGPLRNGLLWSYFISNAEIEPVWKLRPGNPASAGKVRA